MTGSPSSPGATDQPADVRGLVAAVLAVLSELDPYGLEPGAPGGLPADEYALEAGPIAELLRRDGVVTRDGVDAIWHHWFGESLSGVVGVDAVGRSVDRLNGLWERASQPSGARSYADRMAEPTQEQLEKSDKLEKRTVGDEIRYYIKDIKAHWPVVVEEHPDAAGHEAWWTRDGKFHATHAQLRRDAMIGGIV